MDTDSSRDVFVRDVSAGATELVSRNDGPNGAQGSSVDQQAKISADGRYVVFTSFSTNLPEDIDATQDVFIRDRELDSTRLVSRGTGGGDKGNDFSVRPSVSTDGKYTVFASGATNLHPDDGDSNADIFMREYDYPPTVSITAAPPSGRSADATPSITFSTPDDDPVIAECFMDDVQVLPDCNVPNDEPTPGADLQDTFTSDTLSDGPHTFTVRLRDFNGYGEFDSVTFTIDKTGPSAQLTSQPPASTEDTTPSVEFTATAPDLESFECSVDEETYAACTSPFTSPSLAPGAHTIDVRALDDLGNSGVSVRASFTVVDAPPSVSIIDAPPARTADATPSITYATPAEDTLFAACTMDGVPVAATCNVPNDQPTPSSDLQNTFTSAPLADGPHTFGVTLNDDAPGNTATASVHGRHRRARDDDRLQARCHDDRHDADSRLLLQRCRPGLVPVRGRRRCLQRLYLALHDVNARARPAHGRRPRRRRPRQQRSRPARVLPGRRAARHGGRGPEGHPRHEHQDHRQGDRGAGYFRRGRGGHRPRVRRDHLEAQEGQVELTSVTAAPTESQAGETVALELKYPGSAKKRKKATKKLVKGIQKGGKATIEVQFLISDEAGNSATLERSAKLKAKKKRK